MSFDSNTIARLLPAEGAAAHLVCFALQPILSHIVNRIASRHPSLFARLGPHQRTDFLIDPVGLPFALHLRPDPQSLVFRAVPRNAAPRVSASIRGKFLLLLKLVDAEEDGDAAFFSRDLDVTGDTEAVGRDEKLARFTHPVTDDFERSAGTLGRRTFERGRRFGETIKDRLLGLLYLGFSRLPLGLFLVAFSEMSVALPSGGAALHALAAGAIAGSIYALTTRAVARRSDKLQPTLGVILGGYSLWLAAAPSLWSAAWTLILLRHGAAADQPVPWPVISGPKRSVPGTAAPKRRGRRQDEQR